MLNPSRQLVLFLALLAVVALLLGLASDVGLFGWSFALLLALYLGAAGLARRARRSSVTDGRPT